MDDFTKAFRGGYRKRAFLVQYNLILLFGAVAFAVASASVVPLVVGASLEVVWLVTAPWFRSFRAWVDAKGELDDGAAEPFPLSPSTSPSPRAPLSPPSSVRPPLAPPTSLSPFASSVPPSAGGPRSNVEGDYAERVQRLAGSMREIRALADEELRKTRSEELTVALATIPEVTQAFERVCKLHQRLSRYVVQASKAELEQDVAKLSDEFAREKDLGLRVTLRQALIIAQRRLEEHDRIVSLHRATALRLDMIEGAAAHVRSRGLTMSSPDDFATEIRALLTHVASVNALERDSTEGPSSRRSAALPPLTGAAAGEG
ncbi:MAG TPA: hypothetical protein VH062_17980 [Polyangiaceae bacterium]|jgi:hypothetical protein|nr:hypothetical protein [Polyangiaceae bacterium]